MQDYRINRPVAIHPMLPAAIGAGLIPALAGIIYFIQSWMNLILLLPLGACAVILIAFSFTVAKEKTRIAVPLTVIFSTVASALLVYFLVDNPAMSLIPVIPVLMAAGMSIPMKKGCSYTTALASATAVLAISCAAFGYLFLRVKYGADGETLLNKVYISLTDYDRLRDYVMSFVNPASSDYADVLQYINNVFPREVVITIINSLLKSAVSFYVILCTIASAIILVIYRFSLRFTEKYYETAKNRKLNISKTTAVIFLIMFLIYIVEINSGSVLAISAMNMTWILLPCLAYVELRSMIRKTITFRMNPLIPFLLFLFILIYSADTLFVVLALLGAIGTLMTPGQKKAE